MRLRKAKASVEEIVQMRVERRWSLMRIAERAGISERQVRRILRARGVARKVGEHIATRCDFCSIPITKPVSEFKRRATHFCSYDCYHASQENPRVRKFGRSSPRARIVARQYVELDSASVVIQKDGDSRNIAPANLMVFTSAANYDHWKSSRSAKPFWDGASVACAPPPACDTPSSQIAAAQAAPSQMKEEAPSV